jgi:molybdopterin converting factor small subunit
MGPKIVNQQYQPGSSWNKRKSSAAMKIELRLYASLGRYMPERKGGSLAQVMEFSEGTTIGEVLQKLNVPQNAVKLIFVNGVRARIDEALKDGDRVGIFPPVAGG